MKKMILILATILTLLLSSCGADMREAMKEDTGESVEAPAVVQISGYYKGGEFSGDDVYDPAAGVTFKGALESGGFSGDDSYDPAADLRLAPVKRQEGTRAKGGSFSGDDAYDPAAGGTGQ